MDKKEVTKAIRNLKRTQRREGTQSELIKDKLFNVKQMCDSFDSYLNHLIITIEKLDSKAKGDEK